MIEGNEWHEQTPKAEYATFGLGKKDYVSLRAHAVSLGPLELHTSANHLAKMYWVVEVIDGSVELFKMSEAGLEFEATLFYDPTIEHISLGFDQLGKPLVAYTAGPKSVLWWFNPLIEEHEHKLLPGASHVLVGFDRPWQPGTSLSDAIVFIVKDGAVKYLLQRDRYETEYATPVVSGATRLLQVGTTLDYRLQFTCF